MESKFSDVRYAHFVNPSNPFDSPGDSHNGVVTAAYVIIGDDIAIGTSWCDPRDQFVKKEGRNRATGRLRQGKHVLFAKRTNRHILEDIVDAINAKVSRPPWSKGVVFKARPKKGLFMVIC